MPLVFLLAQAGLISRACGLLPGPAGARGLPNHAVRQDPPLLSAHLGSDNILCVFLLDTKLRHPLFSNRLKARSYFPRPARTATCHAGKEARHVPSQGKATHTPAGQRPADTEGSPVGAARVDVERSYAGIGGLLRRWIDECDDDARQTIRAKIDYTYECLDMALGALEKETGFVVNPMCIDPQTRGPDGGSPACTEWPFVAALMRWFRDEPNISCHRTAVGEAATVLQATAQFYSSMNPEGRPVTPEAVIEGRVGDFCGGWGLLCRGQRGLDPRGAFAIESVKPIIQGGEA